jgi:type II secretory ATPase GspE/PulE/Tfp pilus assembly ATPase PilB-like protein
MSNTLIEKLISQARSLESQQLVIEEANCSFIKNQEIKSRLYLSKKQETELINTFNIFSQPLKNDLYTNLKIKIKHRNKIYNCYLSSLPADKENKIVMRLEESKLSIKRLTSLGFSKSHLIKIKEALNLKQGLILISGQANSGKTTSYYSFLNHLNKNNKSFYSLEKYPEINIPYVTSLEINENESLNNYLEKLRKYDADTVGIDQLETKDEIENALIQASNGHLIIATIEAKSVLEALRLILKTNLSIKQIASSLRLIIGQKILKKTCPYCLKEKTLDKNYLSFIKSKTKGDILFKKSYYSQGCSRCNFTGHYNNLAVFEIMKILKNANIDESYKPLIYDALEKANNGLFSSEEIFKSFK